MTAEFYTACFLSWSPSHWQKGEEKSFCLFCFCFATRWRFLSLVDHPSLNGAWLHFVFSLNVSLSSQFWHFLCHVHKTGCPFLLTHHISKLLAGGVYTKLLITQITLVKDKKLLIQISSSISSKYKNKKITWSVGLFHSFNTPYTLFIRAISTLSCRLWPRNGFPLKLQFPNFHV